MTPAQQFAAALKLPPAQAAAALASRNDMTLSWAWTDVYEAAHANTFTVSRLVRADLLQAIYDSLVQSVAGDLSRRDWTRNVRTLLQLSGWWGKNEITNPQTGEIVQTRFDHARLKLIFDTNTRQAYSAGRWQRTIRHKDIHPYIRYITMKDEKVRHLHRQWEGVTLPVEHPFWRTHLPPNGWRCRCRWASVSQADYDKGYSQWRSPYSYDKHGNATHIPTIERVTLKKQAPEIIWRDFLNRSTGQIIKTPAGIDPGFGYNAGIAASQAQTFVTNKLAALKPPIAAAAIRQGLITEQAFAKWLKNPQGEIPLLVLPVEDAEKIGSSLRTAILSSQTAEKQLREHPDLTAAEYLSVQTIVDYATSKVQDSPRSMIYIRELLDEASGGHVLVVKATQTGEGLFVTSFRRLPRSEAQRDSEIRRLLRKKK